MTISASNTTLSVGSYTFTTVANDGATPQRYEFWVKALTGDWTMEQIYSTDGTFIWTAPETAGQYTIGTRIKANGSLNLADIVKQYEITIQ